MKYNKLILTLAFLASGFAAPVSAAPIYQFQTVLGIGAGAVDGIDSVVIDWNSAKNAGGVNASDLDYLSVSYLAGAASLFTDVAIVGGVVQAIGGAARPFTDVFFDFANSTSLLRQIRTALPSTMTAAVGTQYVIEDGYTIPRDNAVYLHKYVDGGRSGTTFAPVVSQVTNLIQVSNVPEPASIALLGLGLAALVFSRRRLRGQRSRLIAPA